MAKLRRLGGIYVIELDGDAEAVQFFKDVVGKKDITKMQRELRRIFKELEDEITRNLS